MKTPLRLSLFAVSLAAVFGAAWGAGTLAGPVTTTAEGTAMASHNEQHEPAGRVSLCRRNGYLDERNCVQRCEDA